MSHQNAPSTSAPEIAPEIIRVATGRVCASETFKKAGRAQLLLRYLVEETLDGRGASPEGMATAMYGDASIDDLDRRLVHDGRRLAEKLAEFYEFEGADDPLRIRFDLTRLQVRFELWETPPDTLVEPKSGLLRRVGPLGTGILFALIAMAAFIVIEDFFESRLRTGAGLETAQPSLMVMDETALLDAAAAGMTAEELDRFGRDYLFPTLDVERQKQATAHFRMAIANEPKNATSYASAAYSLGTLSMITVGSGRAQRYLAEAKEMRDAAIARAPEDPWVLAAIALIAYVERDFDFAITVSERAYAAGRDDPYVAGVYTLIALVSGRYEDALRAASTLAGTETQPVIWAKVRSSAMASFHLNQYADVLELYEAGIAGGMPHNELSTMYMAASLQAVGKEAQAREHVLALTKQWPGFRPDLLAGLFMRDTTAGDDLMRLLTAAGWQLEN